MQFSRQPAAQLSWGPSDHASDAPLTRAGSVCKRKSSRTRCRPTHGVRLRRQTKLKVTANMGRLSSPGQDCGRDATPCRQHAKVPTREPCSSFTRLGEPPREKRPAKGVAPDIARWVLTRSRAKGRKRISVLPLRDVTLSKPSPHVVRCAGEAAGPEVGDHRLPLHLVRPVAMAVEAPVQLLLQPAGQQLPVGRQVGTGYLGIPAGIEGTSSAIRR